jgi:serine/threonine-protein kinase
VKATGRIAQYELLELLGENPEASTYRVRAAEREGNLVLKRCWPQADESPGEAAHRRRALIATARRWAEAPPAGTLRVIDAGELGASLFLVTSWQPEPTLGEIEDLLHRNPESALHVLRSIGDVLDRLHGAGTVHRSLKTSNVLVMEDGNVLLVDALHLASCSRALAASDPSPARAVIAAPEQAMGFRQTPASNRYVFATIAYRLLSGAPVFPQGDVAEYLYSTVYRVPRPVSRVREGLPAAWDRLLAWGLDKEPSARPRTCVELIDALSEALAQDRAPGPREADSAVAAELPWEVGGPPVPHRVESRDSKLVPEGPSEARDGGDDATERGPSSRAALGVERTPNSWF